MRPGRSNLHCHSRFSDGENTLEEMALTAIDRGFVSLGFSEHAWSRYDTDCCMLREDMPLYLREIDRLRRRYGSQIELYAGLEVDHLHPTPKTGLDFTIGSVHYLQDADGGYHCVDHLPEMLEAARDRAAGGDIRELIRLYYESLLRFAADYRPDIVGHVDLICKLNRDGRYFDEASGWYRSLIGETAAELANLGIVVEVNTGGICRGYRDEPYPSRAFLELLRELEVPLTLCSDAHSAATLDFWFDEAEQLLRELGYRSVKQLRGGQWTDVAL